MSIRRKLNSIIACFNLLLMAVLVLVNYFISKEWVLENANAKLQSDFQITYKHIDTLNPG